MAFNQGLGGGVEKNPQDDIVKRIKGFSENFMKFATSTVGWLTASSSMPTQSVNTLAPMASSAHDWMQTRTAFGGQPGFFMGMQQRMLQTEDVTVRSQMQSIMRAYQKLTPERQELFRTVARGTFSQGVQPVGRGAPATAGSDAPKGEDLGGLFGLLDGAGTISSQGDVTLAGEDASIATKTALSVLFPELRVLIGDELYDGQNHQEAQIAISDWTADELYYNPISRYAIDTTINTPPVKEAARILRGNPADEEGDPRYLTADDEALGVDLSPKTIARAAGILGAPGRGSYLSSVFAEMAGDAGRSNPVTRSITDQINKEVSNAQISMSNVLAPLVTGQIGTMAALDINDPDYEVNVQNRMAALGLALPLLGISAGKMGRRIMIARTAAGGSALNAAGESFAGAALRATRSVPRTGPIGVLSEFYHLPVRKVTEMVDSVAVKLARDPEQFFIGAINGRGGRKLLKTMAEAKRLHPDEVDAQVGFMSENFRTTDFPAALVRSMLEQPDVSGAQRVFIDTLLNPQRGSDVIRGLKSQLWQTRQRLQKALSDGDTNEAARLKLEETELSWRLDTTFGDEPMLKYPKQSAVRAIVRAPVTRFQRVMNAMFVHEGRFLDPAKLADEMSKGDHLFVPGHADNPTDYVSSNQTKLSNQLRRAGVKPAEIQRVVGKVANIRTRKEFYDYIEKEVYGKGGVVDRALSKNLDPEIRRAILQRHNKTIETRTRSRIWDVTDTKFGKLPVVRHVLGKQVSHGETTPLPSCPTEHLNQLSLPDVDLLIEANSFIRRAVSRAQRSGGPGNVAAKIMWQVPIQMMRSSTAIMKPLVMLVRLPAMAMRIQLEQALRAQAFGYKPWAGMPDGLSILPGGIPVPLTNVRLLKGLFGEDGWRLLDPDARYEGLKGTGTNETMGMFQEETYEARNTETADESTVEFRSGDKTPSARHYEGWREPLEVASNDWLKQEIARLNGDVDEVLAYLDGDEFAAHWYESQQREYVEDGFDEGRAAKTSDEIDAEYQALVKQIKSQFVGERDSSGEPVRPSPGDFEDTWGMSKFADELDEPDNAYQRQFDELWEDGEVELVQEQGEQRVFRSTSEVSEGIDVVYWGVNPEGKVVAARDISASGNPNPLDTDVLGLSQRAGTMEETLTSGSVAAVTARSGQGQAWGERLADAQLRDAGGGTDFAGLSDSVSAQTYSYAGMSLNLKRAQRMERRLRAGAADPKRQWIQAQVDYLKQITSGDPDLMRAIATGRLRTGHRISPDAGADGQLFSNKIAQAEADIDIINREIKQRVSEGHLVGDDTERAALEALQRARLRAIKARNSIEAQGGVTQTSVKLGDKKAFKAELKRRWEENSLQMPSHIQTKKNATREMHDGGLHDDTNRIARAIGETMYRAFKPLSYVDKKGTRGSLFKQAEQRFHAELVGQGYSPAQAKAIAYDKAGVLTRDLMYDLNARTSFQRALKDVFWFLPAQQEVLYTWLVKAPAQSYWPVGAAALASKFVIGKAVLEEIGVLQENERGEAVFVIPGMDTGIEKFAGIFGVDVEIPEIIAGKASGLNLITSGGGAPGLSQGMNLALGQASLKFGGFFKRVSDIFQPYGAEMSVLPMPLTYAWELTFGAPPPWDGWLSPEYSKAQYDRSVDTGQQYAYHELKSMGVTVPKVEDYGHTDPLTGRVVLDPVETERYQKAKSDYRTRLLSLGTKYTNGIALMKLLGSTVAPMSLHSTNEDKLAFQKFMNNVVFKDDEFSGGMTDEQKQQIDDYVQDHPNSMAYSVFYTQYGDKTRDLPFKEEQDDAYWDAFLTGERRVMSGEDYSHKLMSMTSLRFYQNQLDTVLDDISPDRNPWELLTNGTARSDALVEFSESWARYKFLNPEADEIIRKQRRLWADKNDVPTNSFESERLSDAIRAVKAVAPMLSGEEGIRPAYLREFQGNMAALFSESNPQFGAPETKTEKAMAWWYNKVLDPYISKTSALYEEAERLTNLGLSASTVYNEIKAVNNSLAPKYKGQAVPRAEEVLFSNRTPEEQNAARYQWASRPISWLSTFQANKVGYNMDEATQTFFDDMSESDTDFWDYMNRSEISPSSEQYDKLLKWRESTLAAKAEAVGSEAVRLFALSESAPVARLSSIGYGAGNAVWGDSFSTATAIAANLRADDLSPRGFSESAVAYKSWFYQTLDAARDSNPEFERLMTELSYSFPMTGGGWRQGAVLYEAVFFGNFNEKYIPYQIAVIGAGA